MFRTVSPGDTCRLCGLSIRMGQAAVQLDTHARCTLHPSCADAWSQALGTQASPAST
jgi:hypothetical protein